jgi:hypothetical protein
MRDDVRIVRVGHRHDETERAAVAAASEVKELLAGGDHDLVIEVDLIGARARARLDDRIHAVIPARALLEGAPVGRPAEIAGVDVGRQALLKSMQLIGPAEVHLAGEGGLIARAPQVVGEGGHLGGIFGSVVVGANFRGQLAGEERKARWRAQRAVAVEGFEDDTRSRERIDVGVRAIAPPYARSTRAVSWSAMRIRRFGRSAICTPRIASIRVCADSLTKTSRSTYRQMGREPVEGASLSALRQIPESILQRGRATARSIAIAPGPP